MICFLENLTYTTIRGDFTRNGDFTWRVSDCEELVSGNRPRSTNWCMTIQYYNINYNQAPKNTNWPGLP